MLLIRLQTCTSKIDENSCFTTYIFFKEEMNILNQIINKLFNNNILLWLLVIGLFFILLGNIIDFVVLKIDIGALCASIGSLFLVITTLQWIFDSKVRDTLIKNILENQKMLVTAGPLSDTHSVC